MNKLASFTCCSLGPAGGQAGDEWRGCRDSKGALCLGLCLGHCGAAAGESAFAKLAETLPGWRGGAWRRVAVKRKGNGSAERLGLVSTAGQCGALPAGHSKWRRGPLPAAAALLPRRSGNPPVRTTLPTECAHTSRRLLY